MSLRSTHSFSKRIDPDFHDGSDSGHMESSPHASSSVISRESDRTTPRLSHRKSWSRLGSAISEPSNNVLDVKSYIATPQSLLPVPKDPEKCPLFCCFYAEFDDLVGPKMCFQSPRGFMDQDINSSISSIHEILAKTFAEIRLSDDMSADSPQPAALSVKNRQKVAADDDGHSSKSPLSIFDSCSEYIITGSELSGNILNLSTHQIHVLTRPTAISDESYVRNSLLFSVGFVLRRAEDPRPFRSVLSKLAVALYDMEVESKFLTSETTRPHIQVLLERMLISLNSPQWECNIRLTPADVLNLKLFHPPKSPTSPVPDHAVPVLLRRDWQVQTYEWDLAINWVSLHIDGASNARQISTKAEVDMEMVRACLRVLKHHGIIALVDMFFFTNRYESTSKAAELLTGKESTLLQSAAEYCVRKPQGHGGGPNDASPTLRSISPGDYNDMRVGSLRYASFTSHQSRDNPSSMLHSHRTEDNADIRRAIAELFCMCNRAMSLGDTWINLIAGNAHCQVARSLDWKKLFHLIDHRRLASFGQIHGLIHRLHNYPLLLDDISLENNATMEPHSQLALNGRRQQTPKLKSKIASMMDGTHCDDELVSIFEKPFEEILRLFNPDTVFSIYANSVVNVCPQKPS